jgi:hypothetical protein
MYRYFKGLESKGWSLDIDTYVRSFNGKDIRLHKINDVFYSGEQEVYLLTLENGRSIKATRDHKILTKRGWVELINLKETDEIMCDNESPTKKLRKTIKKYDVQLRVPNHPYSFNSGRVEIHRLCYEAKLNNMDINQYLDVLLNEESFNHLKFVDPDKYVIHHKDNNHYNNGYDNLECLDKIEHYRHHGYTNYSNFNQSTPFYSKFNSIEKIGVKKTYDIQCEDPHHNFNANGIIVHNSGKSFGLALTVATYLSFCTNNTFTTKKNIVFSTTQLEDAIATAEVGEVIMFDEFILAGASADAMSKVQKTLTKMFTLIRYKRLSIILIMPYFTMMTKYFAVSRTRWLMDAYNINQIERGNAIVYGYQRKGILYNICKKNNTIPSKFYNPQKDGQIRFIDLGNKEITGIDVIDFKEYATKKEAALLALDKNDKDNKENQFHVKLYKRYVIGIERLYSNKILPKNIILKLFNLPEASFRDMKDKYFPTDESRTVFKDTIFSLSGGRSQ